MERVMKKQDDYIAGPHHYWTHFWFGLVVGAGLGAWTGWNLFDDRWAIVATLTLSALTMALSCGRWGDRAWQCAAERLWWFY